MKYISHRGNILGKDNLQENHPNYIDKAICLGYDVEIDVWYINKKLFLGHDQPLYEISYSFFINPKLWTHCKNSDALLFFSEHNNEFLNFFWHEKDKYTITSKGIVWAYPGSELNIMSVSVLPETLIDKKIQQNIIYGICSDYIEMYKNYDQARHF